jgi:hypothetical protein
MQNLAGCLSRRCFFSKKWRRRKIDKICNVAEFDKFSSNAITEKRYRYDASMTCCHHARCTGTLARKTHDIRHWIRSGIRVATTIFE